MKILLAALNAKYIHSCLAIHSIKAYAVETIKQQALAENPAAEMHAGGPLHDDAGNASPGDHLKIDTVECASPGDCLKIDTAECASPGDCLKIDTAEYTINQPLDDILRDICRRQPDLIAFSCYIWNIEQTKKLAALLHMVMPQLPVWAGGPEVSYAAGEILAENESIFGIMCGEGEAICTALIQAYARMGKGCPHSFNPDPESDDTDTIVTGNESNPRDSIQEDLLTLLRSVPGIVCRDGHGGFLRTPAPAPLDMDDLPFPYPELLPDSEASGKSNTDAGVLAHRIPYYESSRGCPFACSYCLSSIDRQVRFKSLPKVFAELSVFLAHRVPLVKFVDRTFNCDHKRTLAIWRFLRDHDNQITRFHFEVTAELLNEEELALLAELRPGLVQLEIGVQSVNPDTLAAIDRKQDISHLAQTTERIRQAGNVHQHLDLIAGLPYEDLESFGRSFDTVYQMQPAQLQLGFLKLLKGSKMYRMKDAYGLQFRPWPPYEVISTRWLSAGDTLKLKCIEEMVETYYNSRQFQKTLEYLLHFFQRPWDLFAELAEWMEENRHLGISHNRLTKYDLLRKFAMEILETKNKPCRQPEHVAEFAAHCETQSAHETATPGGKCESHPVSAAALDAVLLYDLYLREKLKTRPTWAPDPNINKERISALYADENFRQRYLPDLADESVRQIRHETHLEIFPYKILQTAKSRTPHPGEQILLFNYRKRNPLDGAAEVQEVSQ